MAAEPVPPIRSSLQFPYPKIFLPPLITDVVRPMPPDTNGDNTLSSIS